MKYHESDADFFILMGDFLDELYASDDEVRQEVICEEIDVSNISMSKLYFCYLAATIHKLANDYSVSIAVRNCMKMAVKKCS